MQRIIVLLTLTLSFSIAANESDEFDLFKPDVYLVESTHQYCSDQLSGLNESDRNKAVLDCVNSDLQVSNYETFTSHSAILKFITNKEGE